MTLPVESMNPNPPLANREKVVGCHQRADERDKECVDASEH